MDSPDLLSEVYWKLHRNTLIFSSASILLSSKILKIDKIFDGSIQSSPRLTAFIAFCAALYAFSVYFLEAARESSYKISEGFEALSQLSSKIESDISELSEGVASIRSAIEEPINAIKILIQAGVDPKRHPSSIVNPINYHPLLSPHIEDLKAQIMKFARDSSDLKFPPTTDDEAQQYVELQTKFNEEVRDRLWEIAKRLGESINDQMQSPILAQFSTISDRLESATKISSSISNDLFVVGKSGKKIRNTISIQRALTLLRSFMIGRPVPSIMFALAIYHFVSVYTGWTTIFDAIALTGAT